MNNIYIGILTALLVASSACLAAARVAPRPGESQSSQPPLCSRSTIPPLEQETARPAAKMYADYCSSSDLAALGGDDLINYLQTHSRDCLSDVLWTFDDNMPAIFTNQNMQAVLVVAQGRRQKAVGRPCAPSTGISAPLIQFARSDTRNATTSATSSGVPKRPAGNSRSTNCAKRSGCSS